MNHHETNIKPLRVQQLLSDGSSYSIPIYQRNYAWTGKEIEQLIRDIMDYTFHYPGKQYYIGTLVVAEEELKFSTIDGQQRLTTLLILCCVLKNEFPKIDMSWFKATNLKFASRSKATRTLRALFEKRLNEEELESNMKAAYQICLHEIPRQCKAYNIEIIQFARFLQQFVTILRVPLPNGIDLNHYFEIMNSRGEQLEKHELLKARLMGIFNEWDTEEKTKSLYKHTFHTIWEACNNMERYIQMQFPIPIRHKLFGTDKWDTLEVNSFNDLAAILKDVSPEEDLLELPLNEIIYGHQNIKAAEKEKLENPDRFTSVVNFSNFLLHVLRIQVKNEQVALDDKRLIDIFYQQMPKDLNKRLQFVQLFAYNLLKAKFLFDKYVIKRDENNDRWSLLSLHHYAHKKSRNGLKYPNTFGGDESDEPESMNRRIIMLQSMFHVSHPSQSYKYWLSGTLFYLMKQFEITGDDFARWLEHVVKSFVFDNYLSKNPLTYDKMLFDRLKPINRKKVALNLTNLRYPFCENLIFNFTDYLLWRKNLRHPDERVRNYQFTFRSSVEHYYPQSPFNTDIEKIENDLLHSYGNLCLISHDKNSRLSNFSPKAKKDHYGKGQSIDSIKLFQMMQFPGDWNEDAIQIHENEMHSLLTNNLNSNYDFYKNTTQAQRWFKEYQSRDRNLLVMALLCFGDCLPNIGGDRFNLFDFDYIRHDEAFTKFEAYIEANNPKGLLEIIKKHLGLVSIKKDYRFLFIKYPVLLEYCKEGNFLWENEGGTITLLEYSKRTEYKAKEALSYILAKQFLTETGFEPFTDYTSLYLNIKYEEGFYSLIGNKEFKQADLQLEIWNNEGRSINACLVPYANGNSSSVKMLQDYKWVKNEEGNFERFGNPKLINLEDDFELNISNMIDAVYKLLKNGFGIKLL